MTGGSKTCVTHSVASVPSTTVPMRRQHTARAVGDGDLRAGDLARAALAAQLPHRLDEQEHAVLPGCVYERPPPFVFVGSEPPGPELAVLDERAALALRAEAEVLEVEQRGDREAVVAHQHVDVGRLDAGHARTRPDRETAPAVVVRSGISLIIECVPHVAAPST